MRLGIIGLPNSGKTTIFNALTGSNLPTGAATGSGFEVHTAVVNVPDMRVDKLSEMYKPKKTTRAQITYADIGGLDKGIGEGGLKGQFRNELAQLSGFIHVVRLFEDDNVPHPHLTIDPQRDIQTLDTEFMLTDLISIENRLERLQADLKRKGKAGDTALEAEQTLLLHMRQALENEIPLRDLDLPEDQMKGMRGFGFLTLKPTLIVLNMGDTRKDITLDYQHKLSRVIPLQGKIEAELAQLEGDDQQMFMAEYGVTELSASKVIRLSYELMSIQSFFTVGPDEVRAWSVRIGATAPEAAGAIHNDLQKGFIRAEVMTYEDLITAGSEAAVKSSGKFRLEGKEYIVKDGDIVHIRHSG
ncbi:MAG: redox-regulated ATPase YchF [Chloroflexi bacterium]|nr:redox-regulated ATPase YchF [Chloroflexota bacterium]